MYNATNWKDHVLDREDAYTVTENADGTRTIVPAGKVMQQGTPQDAEHFNNMEGGVLDLNIAYGLLLNFARQKSWQCDDNSAAIAQDIANLAAEITRAKGAESTNAANITANKNKIDANEWKILTGTVNLTNTGIFPFNNSKKSVSLASNMGSINYLVMAEVASSTGCVGDIVASDKLVNGFKLAYEGSATAAIVRYIAIGGVKK